MAPHPETFVNVAAGIGICTIPVRAVQAPALRVKSRPAPAMSLLAMPTPQPSWRKPAGIATILLLILLWAVLVASFAGPVGRLPVLVQALFYLVMGVAWIAPLGPLLRWSQTGRWKQGPKGRD